MTQKEKQLLLKDLCTRLAYGVKVNFRSNIEVLCEVHIYQSVQTVVGESGILYDVDMPNVKPYLRPMSSMTEEEKEEYINTFTVMWDAVDWLVSHHFDFRNLIGKGLAIEAPDNMYKTE